MTLELKFRFYWFSVGSENSLKNEVTYAHSCRQLPRFASHACVCALWAEIESNWNCHLYTVPMTNCKNLMIDRPRFGACTSLPVNVWACVMMMNFVILSVLDHITHATRTTRLSIRPNTLPLPHTVIVSNYVSKSFKIMFSQREGGGGRQRCNTLVHRQA